MHKTYRADRFINTLLSPPQPTLHPLPFSPIQKIGHVREELDQNDSLTVGRGLIPSKP